MSIADNIAIAYGPVPSRRLGKSLGINNIPAKVCSYACIYCQVGRTTEMKTARGAFYKPENIFNEVQSRLTKSRKSGMTCDYLTFVPDGDPTLDENLGKEIEFLKKMKVPIGVITNASLIMNKDVREDLAKADWVSLKIDALQEKIWRKVNRPHNSLQLDTILAGILEFSKTFCGKLATETMLIKELNDTDDHLKALSGFIRKLQPDTAYLSIPTRPPAEKWARRPDENRLNRAYQIFSEKLKRVEYLIGYEGNAFAYTGDAEKDILSITAVHPMRKEAITRLLSRGGSSWRLVDTLLARGDLTVSEYEGHLYYLRRFKKRSEGHLSPLHNSKA